MAHKIVLSSLFVLSFLFVNGQAKKDHSQKYKVERSEKYEAMKIAFLTTKLDLTAESSQVFWPIYNDYQSERKSLRKKYKRIKNVEELSTEECEAAILNIFEEKEEGLNLEKDYVNKLKSVLDSKQLLLLMKSERDFKNKMIDGIKKRRRSGR